MNKFKLSHFEEIIIDQLEEYYKAEFEFMDTKLSIDLNFKGKKLPVEVFQSIELLITDMVNQDEKNRVHIASDYNAVDGDTVKEFMEFHIEEMSEELAPMVDFENKNVNPEVQLMEKLKLVRIGFYLDGKYDSSSFATFDYSVGRELSDQLIVVNVDKKGELLNLAWES